MSHIGKCDLPIMDVKDVFDGVEAFGEGDLSSYLQVKSMY